MEIFSVFQTFVKFLKMIIFMLKYLMKAVLNVIVGILFYAIRYNSD